MVLVAGGDSLNLALWVIGLYAVVQFTESYLLTPLIQARAVFLLPAVVILNQLVLAVLFGILGFALAPRSPPLPSYRFVACSGRKRTRRVKPTRSALLADARHAG